VKSEISLDTGYISVG